MDFHDLEEFVRTQREVVFTTYRKDGRPQQSLVTVGSMEGGLAFTTTEGRAKVNNLGRDPRCSIMVLKPDYRGYAVLDGDADVRSRENTEPANLRMDLRQVYRSIKGEHPNWEEYDRAMEEQRRLVVLLKPGRLFGRNVP
jgi:PPOX class probable F420-dependent enzyme